MLTAKSRKLSLIKVKLTFPRKDSKLSERKFFSLALSDLNCPFDIPITVS